MLCEITSQEQRDAVEQVAAEALAAAGVAQPPVDALHVAHALGLDVAVDARQAGRARYVRLAAHQDRCGRPSILLRPEPRRERRHWAVAHELGEHLAAAVFHRLSVDARVAAPAAREQVANQLAAALLLPGPWFARHAGACDWDLAELKRQFSTASHELVARRMLDFPLPVVVTIFDQDKVYFRRGNLPGRVPPLTALEARCQRSARRSARPCRMAAGALDVRAWPVHEAAWQREILRTEPTDTWDDAL